ncbi:deoxyribonuclease-1 [Formivibrio citricus]|uniref:Deoxyribonuclease-1 n=1 Tax=Formivibrio citricus TaxID=83765 RepID=A0A1I4ZDG2_9NEIS|nr:endonuclease [Formivibrio citricus]SFN48304.1 deoxyribonuclease-1 [Formivibrio citricus]
MRYLFSTLLFSAVLLAGCKDSPAAQQAVATPPESQPNSVMAVELVTSKKQVGHRNFSSAKKILPEVYAGLAEDIYCGCKYTGKDVDLASCGYVPRKNANRAQRIEWEHVVPAKHLGSQRQCWQDGGRKNCSGKDQLFDQMEGDLNNLVPAVGEVNGDRGDMSYGAWTNNPTPVYGQCKSVPDFKNRRFQPREEVRGRVARISLYMHTRYNLSMSNQDKNLWCAWAKTYPVDAWEIERNRRVSRWQGEGNLLVESPEKLTGICQ